MSPDSEPGAFEVRDCTLTALATGLDAQSLRELRDRIGTVPGGSLYYHFWGRLLRPVFRIGEYNNDFADWAAHSLRDLVLAERLAMVDPGEFPDMEGLREELLDIVEERLSERANSGGAPPGHSFHFIRGQLVVFDTGARVPTPGQLPEAAHHLTLSSLFYHFVDARHRSQAGIDDFQAWLLPFGDRYASLCRALDQVDLFFEDLGTLRRRLISLFEAHCGGEA